MTTPWDTSDTPSERRARAALMQSIAESQRASSEFWAKVILAAILAGIVALFVFLSYTDLGGDNASTAQDESPVNGR